MIEYFANTLIFVISGVIIAGRIYAGHQASSPHILTGMDYAWAVALWLLLLVSPYVLQDCWQEDTSVQAHACIQPPLTASNVT